MVSSDENISFIINSKKEWVSILDIRDREMMVNHNGMWSGVRFKILFGIEFEDLGILF